MDVSPLQRSDAALEAGGMRASGGTRINAKARLVPQAVEEVGAQESLGLIIARGRS